MQFFVFTGVGDSLQPFLPSSAAPNRQVFGLIE
jgi:hypothetical protein